MTIRFGHPGVGLSRARELVEKEFAAAKDIKIEWTFFRGAGPAVNESVAAKQLDFFLLGDLPAIVGQS